MWHSWEPSISMGVAWGRYKWTFKILTSGTVCSLKTRKSSWLFCTQAERVERCKRCRCWTYPATHRVTSVPPWAGVRPQCPHATGGQQLASQPRKEDHLGIMFPVSLDFRLHNMLHLAEKGNSVCTCSGNGAASRLSPVLSSQENYLHFLVRR